MSATEDLTALRGGRPNESQDSSYNKDERKRQRARYDAAIANYTAHLGDVELAEAKAASYLETVTEQARRIADLEADLAHAQRIIDLAPLIPVVVVPEGETTT